VGFGSWGSKTSVLRGFGSWGASSHPRRFTVARHSQQRVRWWMDVALRESLARVNSPNSEIYYHASTLSLGLGLKLNRKVAIIIVVVCLSLVAVVILVRQDSSFLNARKFEVTSMELTYGPQTISGFTITGSVQPVIKFAIRNLHNSYLTTVGLSVNSVNQGLQTLQVPPGQIQDESISLKNVALSSVTAYPIEMTFTFGDGSYETYSGSYTTPQFRGQAQVTHSSLTVGPFLANFQIEIQNTGNLPITSAKFFVEGYQFETIIVASPLMPGETARSGWSLGNLGWEVDQSYSVTIPITCFDGSTSTVRTSVVAQSK
jgi:hypothetical protein